MHKIFDQVHANEMRPTIERRGFLAQGNALSQVVSDTDADLHADIISCKAELSFDLIPYWYCFTRTGSGVIHQEGSSNKAAHAS